MAVMVDGWSGIPRLVIDVVVVGIKDVDVVFNEFPTGIGL